MARVTIEDCKGKANRYELVVLAAFRANQISAGALPLVPRNNDRNEVTVLREIAAGKIKIEDLRDALIKKEQVFKVSSSYSYDNNVPKSNDQLEIQKEMNAYQDIVVSEDETLQGFFHNDADNETGDEEE